MCIRDSDMARDNALGCALDRVFVSDIGIFCIRLERSCSGSSLGVARDADVFTAGKDIGKDTGNVPGDPGEYVSGISFGMSSGCVVGSDVDTDTPSGIDGNVRSIGLAVLSERKVSRRYGTPSTTGS